MSTSAALLVPRRERGWRKGLANMLAKEVRAWWRTRRWWIQCLAAVALLNGTLALNLRDAQGLSILNAATTFLTMAAMCVPLAAVSMAQDSILGERHSGAAAWVLSKPLRRSAFILAKLIAHALALLVAWVVLPGVIAYYQLTAASGLHLLSASGFAKAMGLNYLNLLFYMTLALMLAVLFNSRGPVLGIALVLAWSGPMQFLTRAIEKYVPWLVSILPWTLLMPVGDHQALAGYVLMGRALPTLTPIIATLLWCVLFVAVAIWRFRREEF